MMKLLSCLVKSEQGKSESMKRDFHNILGVVKMYVGNGGHRQEQRACFYVENGEP